MQKPSYSTLAYVILFHITITVKLKFWRCHCHVHTFSVVSTLLNSSHAKGLSCNLCPGQRKCCVTTHCILICMAITERRSLHRQSTTGGGKQTECSASWKLHATTQVCLFNQLEVTQPHKYVRSTSWRLHTATQVCPFNQLEVTHSHTGMSIQPTGGYTQPHRYVCSTS